MADITFQDHGSVLLMRGSSDAGKAWIADNVAQNAGYTLMWAGHVVVEPRFVDQIIEGAYADGLAVIVEI
jgi:hypothetical protein